MVERKFLGKPLRDISLEYHDMPMDLGAFVTQAEQGLEGFKDNMRQLPVGSELRYMEEWFETFLAWFEVEQDPNEKPNKFGVEE